MTNQHPHNTVRKWAFPAWLCVVFSLLSSVANAEIEGLFSDAGDALSLEAPSSPDTPPVQRRIVRMDFGQLDAARQDVLAGRPTYLALNLFDEVSFRAIVERTEPTLFGHSLSGRLEGIPFGTMALVLNDTVVMGKVRTLDAVYTIRSAGPGTYMIQRAHPFEFTEAPPLKPVPPASALLSRTDAMATEEDDGSEIDVFVLWTSAAKEIFGGIRAVQASIDLAVVEANDAFAASGTTQRIRLVGTVEADYNESGHIQTHLRRLVNPSDGYLDEAHTLRDSYAADLVHLALGGGCSEFGADGVAYVMEEPSPSFESLALSVSVFCDSYLDGRGLSSLAFAHELGHNMGLQHDRYARFTTLNKPYPYSHGYVNQKAFEDGVTDRARWRTIMSYNDQCADAGFDCRQILRFSNPDQRYNGHPLGIPGDDPSDEVDGPADTARSLDETRYIVANFRRSASRCTYRLARETVTVPAAGGSFSISVESEPDCAYTVQSHDEHLSVSSVSTNRGDGKVTYQVAANEGAARVGSISVAAETLLVHQSGIHAVANVCDRTPEIRDAIMAWSGKDRCSEVTDFDLSEIPYLVLPARGITELRTGDFTGLSSLYWLSLGRNSITGSIPPELGRLTKLRVLGLAGNRLTGSIPPELGRLTKVTLLTLSENKLTGNIPTQLGNLTELNTLDLSDNMLSGNVPIELGRLRNVNTLDLSDNLLTGNIPSELGNIPRLLYLDLSGNRLTDSIPNWFGSLRSLWAVQLHNNQLTGAIPADLGNVTRLRELRLHNNRLTGAIPAELSLPERLRVLHLAGNALTGCIPGILRDVTDNDLDQLALGYCAAVSLAHGGPPDAPGEAGRVTEGSAASLTIVTEPEQEAAFDVAVTISGGEAFGVSRGNRMVTIPSGTTETTLSVDTENDDVEEPDGEFTATILANAEFALIGSRSSASIVIDDDEGPSAPTIVSLTPADGMLTVAWTAPPSSGTPISEYHIRHRPAPPTPGWQSWKRMSQESGGVLQSDITGLKNRVEYDVQVRAVNAESDGAWSKTAKGIPRICPEGIDLVDCQTLLAVRDTLVGGGTALNWAAALPIQEWTGVIPNPFTQRVVNLNLYSRGFRGTIPGELGRLSDLTILALQLNSLTGVIPPQLASLKSLQDLSLANNRLTGTIPPELGSLSSLVILSARENELAGTIPPELGRLANLKVLELSNNQLTGPIPGTLRDLTELTMLFLGGNRLTGCVPGSLRGVAENDLDRLGLPDCAPASVIDLVIESNPLDGRAYGAGERIEISIWFETDVTVSGSPQLALTIGSQIRDAAFVGNRGNGRLVFRYVVESADRDPNGISIATNALSLNGGDIGDTDGESAVLDLGEHAIADHPSHQVRGALRELVPDQELVAGGEILTLDLSRYFNVPEGGTLTYGTPTSSDPAIATAIIEDGLLKIMPLEDGVTTITVTATDDNGVTVTLSFKITVTALMRGMRPWLMGILAEREAGEAKEAGANDRQ